MTSSAITSPIDAFEPFSPKTLSAPHEFWSALRHHDPVHQINLPGVDRPLFMVTRAEDVQQAAFDEATFSNIVPSDIWRWGDLGPVLQPQLLAKGWPIVHTIATADPPSHARYRKMLRGIFAPKAVQGMMSSLQQSIDSLLDDLPIGKRFDFMKEFAIPMPIAMIASILGIPKAEHQRIYRYTDAFVGLVDTASSPEKASASLDIFAEGQHYLQNYLQRFQKEPQNNALSMIANAEDDDGNRLTMEEMLSICYVLVAGGNETTRNALALSAYHLASKPALWSTLKAAPEKIPTFIEELLRVGTPAALNPRAVTKDTELAGVKLPKGAVVFLMWGSANRDEKMFAKADDFDLDRPMARNHLAFGHGIHSCLGAPLARQELILSIQAWLQRYESWQFAIPEREIENAPMFGFRTFAELPLIVQ